MKKTLLTGVAVLALATGAQAASIADVVFIVDESGSMGGEHAFLEDVIPDLDAALAAKSITGNYAVIGYGDSAQVPRTVRNFGTAAATATNLASDLRLTGGTEDGYAGMGYALNQLTFTGSAINFILVTDEDRDDIVNCPGSLCGLPDSYASMLSALNSKKVVLNAILDLNLNGGALGYDGTTSYSPDGSGGFTETAGGGYSAFSSLGQDYGDMALATSGAVWDLGILRSGGSNAESFASAFINVKVEEIQDQLNPIPLPASAWLLVGAMAGMGALKRRKKAA